MAYFELAEDWKSIVMEAIRPQIKHKAEAGLEAAKSRAPVDTGAYKDSLELEPTSGGYRLLAGTDHWLLVEYGVRGRMPAYHPLLGAARDAIKRS